MSVIAPIKVDQKLADESRKQPLWHVVVLCLLTSFAYFFWWFYKTLAKLSAYQTEHPENQDLLCFKNISPLLRTICLVVPLVNFYFVYSLFKNIACLYPHKQSFVGKQPRLAAAILLCALIALTALSHLPGGFCLLSLSAAFPLAFGQGLLNEFWSREEAGKGLCLRYAFSTGELVAIICGSLLLGLNVAAIMMKIQ